MRPGLSDGMLILAFVIDSFAQKIDSQDNCGNNNQ